MRVLDLFSGIGGFSLGLEKAGMETVAFCEIDPFCQKVLKKHWPDVPIFEDVRGFDYDGRADLICGGDPCQPFSVAGKRRGQSDDRHLWPAMFSLIKKYRPRWVIGENVAGHINMGLDDVLADLESEAYTATPFVIPACGVNAPHRRERVWIVGYSEHDGPSTQSKLRGDEAPGNKRRAKKPEKARQLEGADRPPNAASVRRSEGGGKRKDVADTDNKRLQGSEQGGEHQEENSRWEESALRSVAERLSDGGGHWAVEPNVGRVANGVPRRMDRLRALGNAVVPQIPEIIGRAIMEIELAQEEKLT